MVHRTAVRSERTWREVLKNVRRMTKKGERDVTDKGQKQRRRRVQWFTVRGCGVGSQSKVFDVNLRRWFTCQVDSTLKYYF